MIRFENVTKSYKGSIIALEGVSLEISRGEFVFLVGASGSGKTTMLKLLLREEVIDGGRIWVAGREINRLSKWRVPYLRRNLGCVFQDFRLLPNKTVFENVAFALEVIGRARSVICTQVPQVLELVGLGQKASRFPHELSGGEQQRVAIARAFVNRPLILLADEPTGNLDPTTSQGIMVLLDRINRTGTTVVMATHDSGIVDMMRRRVIEIDAGRIIRDQARGIYGLDPRTSTTFGVPAVGAGARARVSAGRPGSRSSRGERSHVAPTGGAGAGGSGAGGSAAGGSAAGGAWAGGALESGALEDATIGDGVLEDATLGGGAGFFEEWDGGHPQHESKGPARNGRSRSGARTAGTGAAGARTAEAGAAGAGAAGTGAAAGAAGAGEAPRPGRPSHLARGR